MPYKADQQAQLRQLLRLQENDRADVEYALARARRKVIELETELARMDHAIKETKGALDEC